MFEKVEEYKAMIQSAEAKAAEELEQFRMKFISKKSVVTELFNDFRNVPNEQKKAFGQALNELKDLAQEKFQALADGLSDQSGSTADIGLDMTLPNVPNETGSIHPLTITTNKIIEIFERMGFNVANGPEIEEDFYNFTALNFPENHPAREMQDTFFIEKDPDKVLRTHTSNVQIRLMEGQKPPFRSIMPGRVFRNEAISARAHCFFHQVEGLYVNKNVGFKDLKETVYHFVKQLFGENTKIRFRPSYFPFTEPSAEIDISCFICNGKGCNVCKYTNWVEIGGCGMVDPNVLKNCGIDPEEYTGFAFGMGIERITMLKYQINDLRLFSENDVRFLNQFKGTF
ncbi:MULTISPECIES: phenylalanine--tRNA ligase subunit alpha [Reichenbachiella]|uniref:Phenylalanine--tRNA ligase alpha subunit n=1 Tax=Reichenbachiella agariperforans TaxID=156994 RepID=A0A1M6NTV1_REIAG|nr:MULTISPECIES: phenylalanine--tRNA ligase subunit alpha [Reichenbachiella]MBU2916035.1 phenylalanine--tRNA ligase subunit alpha [Reichenbachiella agariperforans]PIB37144.1 phenylalanine--tRNA ligase subunit alpha [Reichenbachiella sp. 5M10]RJE71725.1 phenylalanine--tRNA ligase subunit alpha [Reichenbachiella sp. MSK19-1]SHJ99095.1 phenylalanyl-tRNA synthetase, alpha subunit [Reichenbachiella agariperforans]